MSSRNTRLRQEHAAQTCQLLKYCDGGDAATARPPRSTRRAQKVLGELDIPSPGDEQINVPRKPQVDQSAQEFENPQCLEEQLSTLRAEYFHHFPNTPPLQQDQRGASRSFGELWGSTREKLLHGLALSQQDDEEEEEDEEETTNEIKRLRRYVRSVHAHPAFIQHCLSDIAHSSTAEEHHEEQQAVESEALLVRDTVSELLAPVMSLVERQLVDRILFHVKADRKTFERDRPEMLLTYLLQCICVEHLGPLLRGLLRETQQGEQREREETSNKSSSLSSQIRCPLGLTCLVLILLKWWKSTLEEIIAQRFLFAPKKKDGKKGKKANEENEDEEVTEQQQLQKQEDESEVAADCYNKPFTVKRRKDVAYLGNFVHHLLGFAHEYQESFLLPLFNERCAGGISGPFSQLCQLAADASAVQQEHDDDDGDGERNEPVSSFSSSSSSSSASRRIVFGYRSAASLIVNSVLVAVQDEPQLQSEEQKHGVTSLPSVLAEQLVPGIALITNSDSAQRGPSAVDLSSFFVLLNKTFAHNALRTSMGLTRLGHSNVSGINHNSIGDNAADGGNINDDSINDMNDGGSGGLTTDQGSGGNNYAAWFDIGAMREHGREEEDRELIFCSAVQAVSFVVPKDAASCIKQRSAETLNEKIKRIEKMASVSTASAAAKHGVVDFRRRVQMYEILTSHIQQQHQHEAHAQGTNSGAATASAVADAAVRQTQLTARAMRHLLMLCRYQPSQSTAGAMVSSQNQQQCRKEMTQFIDAIVRRQNIMESVLAPALCDLWAPLLQRQLSEAVDVLEDEVPYFTLHGALSTVNASSSEMQSFALGTMTDQHEAVLNSALRRLLVVHCTAEYLCKHALDWSALLFANCPAFSTVFSHSAMEQLLGCQHNNNRSSNNSDNNTTGLRDQVQDLLDKVDALSERYEETAVTIGATADKTLRVMINVAHILATSQQLHHRCCCQSSEQRSTCSLVVSVLRAYLGAKSFSIVASSLDLD